MNGPLWMWLVLVTWMGLVACTSKKPNFVFILTDDQDRTLGRDGYSKLGSLESMPIARSVLMEQGAFLENFHVNTPICCPSRTEFFSGRYYHNVGPPTVTNGTCMHVDTLDNVFTAEHSVFGLLEQAGYTTGLFGKVTNDDPKYWCKKNHLPTPNLVGGMSHIFAMCAQGDYFGREYFLKTESGKMEIQNLPGSNADVYQTAVLGNASLNWIRSVVNKGDNHKPFFAYIGPHAPHYSATPAPWYNNTKYPHLEAPKTPNWGIASPDKTQHIRQNPPFNDIATWWMGQHMRDRWSSLLSVDDMLHALVMELDELKVLENTYIIYTSDHGYKLGQWRIGTSKQHPFDTDIRIPFLMRGPGISKNSTLPHVSGNVDLAPTILDLAGITKPERMDGKSMAPFLVSEANPIYTPYLSKDPWRDAFLVEYKSVGTYYNDHSAIWTNPGMIPPGYGKRSGPRSPVNATKCVEGTEVGKGNCWFVDSTHSNNWRALRVYNTTHNMMYAEYDPNFTYKGELQFKELYDVAKDPYQMTNLVPTTSPTELAAWHHQISLYFHCKGEACP